MKSIVINIGNTNIRFGLFNGDNCEISWVINTKPYRTSDELFIQFLTLYQYNKIDIDNIEKIIIGSVVPQLTYDISRAVHKIHNMKPVLVDRSTPSGVQAKSKQMGTDIYANLVAAHNLYPDRKRLFWTSEPHLRRAALQKQVKHWALLSLPGLLPHSIH